MAKFHDKLTALGFKSYDDYLASEHWLSFKISYRQSGLPRRCLVCNAKRVCLHHTTYKRLGSENLRDVMPLCKEHHHAVHLRLKELNRFVSDTQLVVDELRGLHKATPRKPKKKWFTGSRRAASQRRKDDGYFRDLCNRARNLARFKGKQSTQWFRRFYRNQDIPALERMVKRLTKEGISTKPVNCLRCGNTAKSGKQLCSPCQKMFDDGKFRLPPRCNRQQQDPVTNKTPS